MKLQSRARIGLFTTILGAAFLSACGGSDIEAPCNPSTNPACATSPTSDAYVDGTVDSTSPGDDSTVGDDSAFDVGADSAADSLLTDSNSTGDGAADSGSTGDGATDSGSTGDAAADGGGDGGVSCLGYSALCASGSQCCSGTCDPTSHTCTSKLGVCAGGGGGCTSSLDCCSLSCVGGICQTACMSDGQTCTSNGECCSGTCTGGTCAKLPSASSCSTAGNSCASDGTCCSNLCTGGKCQLAASYCTQIGDICQHPTDCCTGVCNVASGATYGTCAANSPGAVDCSAGVDGTVCGGSCGDCCSRLCEPYGPTGVLICQPANGCHVDGDICRSNSDCCGGAGSGMPGDGTVTCVFMTGQTIGLCRNPQAGTSTNSCDPEGDVCHYKADATYKCTVSSTRNNCCGAPGNSGVCKLDALGIPRCYGGGACSPAGGACAYSGDCCNGLPCVPNPSGGTPSYICATTLCQPSGASCTIDGDCCAGLSCIKPLGSASGTCGTYTPPPPPPTDAGTDSSTTTDSSPTDSSTTTDSGTVSDSTTTTDSSTTTDSGTPDTAPVCALYGQSCLIDANCCSSVTCLTATGAPCNSQAGCTCHNLIF